MALRRHERIRIQNLRISVGARRHHFDERIGIPFLCECDDEECREFVVVPLREFDRAARDRLVVISPAHEIASGSTAGHGDEYALVRPNGEQRAAG